MSDPQPAAELVITRVFDAPRDRVWAAWTKPEQLTRWWGPQGMEIQITGFDLRPGQRCVYVMRGQGGVELWGRFVYREIAAPGRLVWANAFADASGEAVHAEMAPGFPLEVQNEVTLEETEGRTTLTLRSTPLAATEEETAVFTGMLESMQQGFGGTFDKLRAWLAAPAA